MKNTEGKRNPLIKANFISRLFLCEDGNFEALKRLEPFRNLSLNVCIHCWLTPLMQLGRKRMLKEDDMYAIVPEDQSEKLGEKLQRCWDIEVKKAAKESRKPKLSKAIIKCFGKPYGLSGVFALSLETVKVIQPLLLGKILCYIENYDPEDKRSVHMAYGYAAAMSLSVFGMAVLQHLYYYCVQRIGMRLRVAMCHMIYKKALGLSCQAMGQTTSGQIVNLLSNDVNQADEVFFNLHYLLVGPLEVVAIVVLLWQEIGPSCLAGIAVIVLMLPLQTWFGKLFGMYRARTAVLADSRLRIMNEVVSGIRIIKMYAWEKLLLALVTEVRRKEIDQIMKSSYLRGFNMASFFAGSKVIVFITFMAYTLLGNAMSASHVFVTVSLFGTIKHTVTLYIPLAVEKLSESLVSVHRIQNVLLLDEIKRENLVLPSEKKEEESSIEIHNLTCYWDKSLDTPCLQNVSIDAASHQLVAVIGPVGAGKSSLLCSVLGELRHDKGTLKVNGQLTYVSQQPWVFPGTIQSNILFGKDLNPERYEQVLGACALKKDLQLLPDGDGTLIGDRGATLSGGQKARINLARAVYQDADIYLLDDPLSAVDAEVGRHLFEQCICGMLRNKPRILVTHQLQHLGSADQIVVLKEGRVAAQGTYSELRSSGLDFVSLLESGEEQEVTEPDSQSLNSVCSHSSLLTPEKEADQPPEESVRMMSEETRFEGNVSLHIYLKYFTAGCHVVALLGVVLLSVTAEVAYVMQDWWLVYWMKQQRLNGTEMHRVPLNDSNAAHTDKELHLNFYLGIYAGLTAAALVLGYSRSLLVFHGLVRSAQKLHNDMFAAILRAPACFFDVNPIGRVLNRFSKDIGQVDSSLPVTFVDFSQLTLQNIGVVAVAAAVLPFILIPIVPLVLIFLYLQRFYLHTSRDIKRLEAITRSPILSHLSSTLQGLATIRAFRAEERLQISFNAYQDLHTETWFLFLMTSRWFALRLDGICFVFITLATFGCILLRDGLYAGQVGLVLSYAVTLMGNFQWSIRQSAEVENMMTSVERVVEYSELESEAPWETHKRPPPDWPSQGQVTFDHVNFSYSADGPVVLKDISATFQPNEKVGIVGRTGAGKSSLVSALFRMAEPQGKIYIDGVLTSEIGLHDLRQRMSNIPQDPVLFTDTVRKNLDPFKQHTDEDLWEALEQVQLKCVVEELPAKLETVLVESGSNLSIGQRQLVCLARAVLRKNRILIIDEATANVDPRTDELIQQTIREKFRECTVLTIAHRLNTVIDSDRILVLDSGSIQELDCPYTLLQNKEGALYRMTQQNGQAEAAALLESARQAYMRNAAIAPSRLSRRPEEENLR